MTLTATWAASCAQGGTCVVGDTGPGGGKVFYVAAGTFACGPALASTCKYLEAAPTTGTNAWTDNIYAWSGNTTTEIGAAAQGTSIGTGYRNTEAMVAQSSTAERAGTITRAYRGPNNLTDWYLPSRDELNELYTQRTSLGIASTGEYWSSTEPFSATSARYIWFFNGTQLSTSKSTSLIVRPIRAFGLPPFSVTYNGNTHGSGSVPTDSSTYSFNASVTVASNSGSLAKSGYTFGGWCTTQPAAGSACSGTSRAAGSTFSITSNVTLYAVWTTLTCAQGGTCVVGDTGPGGGIVFYVAGSNFTSTGSDCNTACRYLEVAPAASEASRTWATGANQSAFVTGADATAIGSGYQNTVDISAQAGNVAATSAAVHALEYSNGGVSDWHLPSRDELSELYSRRSSVGGLTADWTYWSSSEGSIETASGRTFSAGYSSSGFKKNVSNLARPVRAFGLPPFSVTYNGNTHGSGSVPTDSSTYSFNASVTVASNSGSLAKSGYTFGGWCTTQPAAGSACSGTSRAAGSTFSITSNVTLYAVWTTLTCAQGGTCVVGDTGPGGGVVFYVAGSNFTSTGSDCGTTCRYLEDAPRDQSTATQWCSNNSTTLFVTAAAIGTGMANTNTARETCASGAIQIAADYSNAAAIDWHLPSRLELNELCKYARQQTTGDTSVSCNNSGSLRAGFASSSYWSSSENSGTRSWSRSFGDGVQGDNPKTSSYRVRPIRAF